MDSGSESATAGSEAPAVVESADAAVVSAFLSDISRLLLAPSGASGSAELNTIIAQARAEIARFSSDASVPLLVIERLPKSGEEESEVESGGGSGVGGQQSVAAGGGAQSNGALSTPRSYGYRIVLELSGSGERNTQLVFAKRGPVIEVDKPVSDQLGVYLLREGSAYDNLLEMLGNVVRPYFKSFLKGSRKDEQDGGKLASVVEKSLADAEIGITHLMQSIDIPEITLNFHPKIVEACALAAQEKRKPQVTDLGELAESADFLNALQSGVARWVKEMHKITRLDRDPSQGTTMQEVNFWLSLERALTILHQKRQSDEVVLTLETLKHGKRFHAVLLMDSDSHLGPQLELARDHCLLMKDISLNALLSATTLPAVNDALINLLSNLRKIRSTRYPQLRGFRFVEAISRDLNTQMTKILNDAQLLHLETADWDKVAAEYGAIFSVWERDGEPIVRLIRDMGKRGGREQRAAVGSTRIVLLHQRLATRLGELRHWRRQHDQFRVIVARVFSRQRRGRAEWSGPNGSGPVNGATEGSAPTAGELTQASILARLDDAAATLRTSLDPLDHSDAGDRAWKDAQRRYNDAVAKVEVSITSRLRSLLAGAPNANQMFVIFKRYNALFIRPNIRGPIREYQSQLIAHVKEDIDRLQAKFKREFEEKRYLLMCAKTDMSATTATVMWLHMLADQLDTYAERCADVLGKDWKNHIDGQRLMKEMDAFKKQLDDTHIYEQLEQSALKYQNLHLGRIFRIERHHVSGRVEAQLVVNCPREGLQIFIDIRLLVNYHNVSLTVRKVAAQFAGIQGTAMTLMEALSTMQSVDQTVKKTRGLSQLVANFRRDLQALISEGMKYTWDLYKLDNFLERFTASVLIYQERVETLTGSIDRIEREVGLLETCAYNSAAFATRLTIIQSEVDAMASNNYANLSRWVQELDERIEERLARRVDEAVRLWQMVIEQKSEQVEEARERGLQPPEIQPLLVELRVQAQTIYAQPSVGDVWDRLARQLHGWLAVVTAQPRISTNRFKIPFITAGDAAAAAAAGGVDASSAPAASSASSTTGTYASVLVRLAKVMPEALHAVDGIVAQLDNYLHEWLRYQSLWDLQADALWERLGTDLTRWTNTLVELRRSRSTFDTQDMRKEIFPVIVDYAKVQAKVSLKYDFWHKEMLQKFSSTLGQIMTTFYEEALRSRTALEEQSVDAPTTAAAVAHITFVQHLKKTIKPGTEQVEQFRAAQRLLVAQRFQLPATWLHAEHVSGEWDALCDILERRDHAIQAQVANMHTRVDQEHQQIEKRATEALSEWDKTKPVEGAARPADAIAMIAAFEQRFSRLRDERTHMREARVALGMPDPTAGALGDGGADRLGVAVEELTDLKGVWQALAPIWSSVDELKERAWLSVQPRKLRQQLDELLAEMKKLPAKYRTYRAFEHAKAQLHGYSRLTQLVAELKSEALKDRHWRQIMKEMRVSWQLQDLTLGQVWEADLARHEQAIRGVLLVAQGEMALEEFLKQVREYWTNFELELVGYQNKTKLIKGWDDLFNKLKENQNSLAAMRFSPYFRQFEEDALSWEEKLNRISALFDVWIDVQRRWVYLDGLFGASADINTLLPTESARFASVSSEFVGLMRRVVAAPRVLDVVQQQGIQRLLERLADQLAKIQKALGEYLERERQSFPRFYFVGDEDLLEILGNSKDVARLLKHLKKMFAGVASLEFQEDSKTAIAMISREGERVELSKPVATEGRRINEWLTSFEGEMRSTLANLLQQALLQFHKLIADGLDQKVFAGWLDKFPAQVVSLATEIWWSNLVEVELAANRIPESAAKETEATLALLADSVLAEQPPIRRRKIEALITVFVHKRDLTRSLVKGKVASSTHNDWTQMMRFYTDPKETEPTRCCVLRMSNAGFHYGFEYLGVAERLVQTPLTDHCFLAMTQALHARLGGSPFGPAGTGKTESVKALGQALGRYVLVFNCDETFDFQAMGRILVGLCQVGAWGCFDEFNRLEERMLSAVSQQIQTIQEAVRAGGTMEVELVGKRFAVNANIGIFITMNPGYSGRSNLPDNLKQLFRSLAMTSPDRQLIAQVMLFSQGFRTAETLASKIVPLFVLCKEQLSEQSHYDFGLRALKYVLVSAGNIKRDRSGKAEKDASELGDEAEQQILIQSVCETLVPKLVSDDITLLTSLMADVFPAAHYTASPMIELRAEIARVCEEWLLVHSDSAGEPGSAWVDKVLQLYQITCLNHGLMLVGSSATGKTTAWRVLLRALERLERRPGQAHVIDAKAMSKDVLYGTLDPNTREWTDGLFTAIIRRVIDNVRGEADRRQWIVFDGDVDPEWVENLNSVLDDNRLLTLPNGERLAIPSNVRIIFEVADLTYATLATVSRCGMVWFAKDAVTRDMLFATYLNRLHHVSLENEAAWLSGVVSSSTTGANTATTPDGGAGAASITASTTTAAAVEQSMTASMIGGPPSSVQAIESRALQLQRQAADVLAPHFQPNGLVQSALRFALTSLDHIMDATEQRLLSSFFAMTNYSLRQLQTTDANAIDFRVTVDQVEAWTTRTLLLNLVWAFAGDARWKDRQALSDHIRQATTISMPPNAQAPLVDYWVAPSGEWEPWIAKVPSVELEATRVAAADVVVPTVDTLRHEMLLSTWLAEHRPLVLCGPPGSGKTMTLLSALRSQQDMDVVNVNFSSSTTPELLIKTFEHYCEYRRTPNGVVLAPVALARWLVVFCDEINLPMPDRYGTQRVISFLRQLVESNGFYRTKDHAWVTLERIQFVGACNPPTDPGRHPLTQRFLRWVPIVYVDYPGEQSLLQIYGTFNRAMLKLVPQVRGLADALTHAMVDVYLRSQERFTADEQPHYVYSPRELTRWVRGIAEAIAPLDSLAPAELVRLWAHEALRLFQDRLVTDEERKWTDDLVDSTAEKYFGTTVSINEALQRPLLYSNWLSTNYVPVSRNELKDYVQARLKGFYEEELDVQLVLFDQMLDHVLRIDRIYRQPQGHLLLIGTSGAGKTTLARFVAWLNGLSVVQLKVHSKYTAADFDDDMRAVLRRAGCKNERVCFIMDESNMLDTGFLERLNTLLANGEVPGLFEGDEHTTLMSQVKEAAARAGQMLDSPDELYKWFTAQVMRNLHVVFTMNPTEGGLRDRASTSPALFNRCVLTWFGDWADASLYQVGAELTCQLDMDRTDYEPPLGLAHCCDLLPTPVRYRDAVVNTMVLAHGAVRALNRSELRRGHRAPALTPRHFLDFIRHYTRLFHEKRRELEDERVHLNIGLNKINETQEQVRDLQASLQVKSRELEEKQAAANAKLQQMLADQQRAVQEKEHSEKLKAELSLQLEQIAVKKAEVEADLSKVEPAVADAQLAVRGIDKKLLVEVRSLAQPPNGVKLTLESVCVLLGETAADWKAIRGVMMKEDFLPRILSYKTSSITADIAQQMQKYVNNVDWEFDKVNRASNACGPLVKWAKAQLLYAEMLHKVAPLRNELARLEQDAQSKTNEDAEVAERIDSLEQSIGRYKEEYAQLIGQTETIKQQLGTVQQKVRRSQQLLDSLRAERSRWTIGRDGFEQQMETLVGDALLAAAFLAYGGYFDQQLRETLWSRWQDAVKAAGVRSRPELARIEYLSTADERLGWHKNGLTADDLQHENAVMLKRFNRYPLVVDPSGAAADWLMAELAGRNIQKTSFLDASFRKNLESALRFGNSLLVLDTEAYDPILNPVLNREVKRSGGRVLITIGDQDIDLSPAFQIFLFSRDASAEWPADLSSRVTFVNFTVTSSSLAAQCLQQVLRSERPDVDARRQDMLKLQGEFAVRLRQLEKQLLDALNNATGKILDDDSVIQRLEQLKSEAAEVAAKAADNDKVMAEVEQAAAQYSRLASACSAIFQTLAQLNDVHFLYHYSLDFLLEIFRSALHSPRLQSLKDHAKRLELITDELFQTVYERVSRGMLHAEKVLLGLLLLRIRLRTSNNKDLDSTSLLPHWDFVMGRHDVFAAIKSGGESGSSRPSTASIPSEIQKLLSTAGSAEQLARLARLPGFEGILERMGKDTSALTAWLKLDNAEQHVPSYWNTTPEAPAGVKLALFETCVCSALRPDRVVAAAHRLVDAGFGPIFSEIDRRPLNLAAIVDNEVTAASPLLLCSAVGYDASKRVEDLAVEQKRSVASIAIGSAEGFAQADSALAQATKHGGWVLLKNVHLAPAWLSGVEKRLHTTRPHASFRLFLTAEIHPKLPAAVVRVCRLVVFEPAAGLKPALLRSISALPPQRLTRPPAERTRLYFLVCWLHALVQERLRYTPLGWANAYEFAESDLRQACDTLDQVLDAVAQGRANVSSDKLPWQTLRLLLSKCIYGGKIDNTFDQQLLDSIINKLFSPAAFEPDHTLIERVDASGDESLKSPTDATTRDALLNWVEAIDRQQLPAWLGLPNNAERVLLTLRGEALARNLLRVAAVDDELGLGAVGGGSGSGGATAVTDEEDKRKPQWMATLLHSARQWLGALPKEITRLRRSADNIKCPLFRFFEREVNACAGLLATVRDDLTAVEAVCAAGARQSNHTRQLIAALSKGVPPAHWASAYAIPKGTTLRHWVPDLAQRCEQLVRIAGAPSLKREEVWLGGLFAPEAYFTATRQLVAQASGWSLEQLRLDVRVGRSERNDVFRITGLEVMGAECVGAPARFQLSDDVRRPIDVLEVAWTREPAPTTAFLLPLYLYQTRAQLVARLAIETADRNGAPSSAFYERSVAFVANAQLS